MFSVPNRSVNQGGSADGSSSAKLPESVDHADPSRDLAGVLHDVSNSLTVLLGWIGEARMKGATRESVDYALQLVEQRARMARDIARHAIGASSLSSSTVLDSDDDEMGRVVAEMVDALAVEAERAEVRIVLRGESAVRVRGPVTISQVLTNVVLNALAFSPPGGVIRIRLSSVNGDAQVEVSDDGPGIATEMRQQLFEGGSTRKGGAGIGLRYARSLARSSGGDLELAVHGGSKTVRGATFILRWPSSGAAAPQRPSAARINTQQLSGKRVLVVEDDDDVISLLETALEARGAEVFVARTAADISIPKDRRFDVALIDLSPIIDDVPGALAAVRLGSPSVAIVAMTGNVNGLPDAIARDLGGCVRKPFDVAEVVAAISNAMGRRAQKHVSP